MPILTDFDPLSMNVCIFSAFDQKRPFNCWTNVARRKILNKMTECFVNALNVLVPSIFVFCFCLSATCLWQSAILYATVFFYKSDILQTYQYKFGLKVFKMASGSHV